MKRRLQCAGLVGLLFLATALPAFSGTITVRTKLEAQQVRLRLRATKFLDHATFGATRADIDALAGRMEQIGMRQACEEWIDQQFAMQPTFYEPLALQMIADDGFDPMQTDIWVQRYRHHAFFHNAISAPDQLRQRTAWALIQICVINDGSFGASPASPTISRR